MVEKSLIEKAIELIDLHSDFDEEMAYHLKNGFVFSSPTCFALAEMKENVLVVNFVVGNLKELLNKIPPLEPEYISFEKHGKIKKYNYKTFISYSSL